MKNKYMHWWTKIRRRRNGCRYYAPRGRNQELAENRLALLRRIIELGYTHEPCKDLFYKKVCDLVSIEELKRHPVVDFEAYREFHSQVPLSKDDLEFYCLLEAGFLPRELSIIYGHANPVSVYVKKHRIMSKLKSAPVGISYRGA